MIIFVGDCRRKGHWWNGVGLKNPAGVSQYGKLTYTDCQELCRITDQCHFFHFRAHNKMCFLKSGNGFGHQVNNKGYLGHKLSKGIAKRIFHLILPRVFFLSVQWQ